MSLVQTKLEKQHVIEILADAYDKAELIYFLIIDQGLVEGYVEDRLTKEVEVRKIDVTDSFHAGYLFAQIQNLEKVYYEDVVKEGIPLYTISIYKGEIEYINRYWDIVVLVVEWDKGLTYIYIYLWQ